MKILISGMYVFTLIFLLLLVQTKDAYAYLDPSTGSYFFQIIVAFIFGGVVTIKMYGRKIITKIKNLGRNKDTFHDD